MERIRLTRDEKDILQMIASGHGSCPSSYPCHIFSSGVDSLERKGLVRCAYKEGGYVEAARLTNAGRDYLEDNPRLRNPIDWGIVGAVAWIIAAAASLAALIIACNALAR